MKYKLFGKTGLRVSELCLGTMTFGEEWGWGASKDESRKVFDAFCEKGGNFIDTANFYTGGTSEIMLGDFVHSERERFVIATKYTLAMDPKDPNASGNHRKNLYRSVKESLKRLNTDYMDILWVHAWDEYTPIEETMRALDDMVRSGQVHYIGISDTPAWIVSRANTLAEEKGWTQFSAIQVEYNLLERTPERELLPLSKYYEMSTTCWSPLAGGALTGKYLNSKPDETRFSGSEWGDRYMTPESNEITKEVLSVADELGRKPSQVALNWVLSRKEYNTIPIIGARKLTQLQDNLECVDIELSQDHLTRLNDKSKISLGFPGDFLNNVRNVVYGEQDGNIINHRHF